MKKINTTFILMLLLNLAHAQNPLAKQWDSRFGGTGSDVLESFQQTADGGYIAGGWTWSDSSGDITQHPRDTSLNWSNGAFHGDYWIVKTDAAGNKQWEKRFGGFLDDNLYAVKQCPDGGYLLGGESFSGVGGDKSQPNWDTTTNFSNASRDFWIVKIDSLGNRQWDKRYGGTKEDQLFAIDLTRDGGYILGGTSTSDSSGDKTSHNRDTAVYNYDYWIVKIDSLGNKQWDRDFGGSNSEFNMKAIHQTNDGGYIFAGTSESGISGDKTDTLRDTLHLIYRFSRRLLDGENGLFRHQDVG